LGEVNAPEPVLGTTPVLGADGPNWRRRQRSSDGSSASTGSERRGALRGSVVLSEGAALVSAVLLSIVIGGDEEAVVGAWAPSADSCGRLVAVRVPPSCSRRRVTTLTTAPR
jgi:hypothetical protein